MKKILIALVAGLALTSLLLACAPKPAPAPVPAPKPAPAPAPAVMKWRLVSMWGEPEANYKAIKKFAENVKAMSNGQIVIETFSSGALMPYTEYFDAVRGGVVELMESGAIYYAGKDSTLGALNSTRQLIGDTGRFLVWIFVHGGIDLTREVWAKWDLFEIAPTPYSWNGESVVSKKPIRTFADVKGVKMRAPEDAADTWKALGADTLTIPGAEVYTALSTGLVDFADWSSPGANYRMKFHEVAKYYSRPGDYHPGGIASLVIHMDTWKKLPDDLKAILLQAGKAFTLDTWMMSSHDDFLAQDLLRAAGAEMIVWEPEFTKKVQELYMDSIARRWIKTDLARKIYDNIQEFKKLERR